MAWRTLCDLDPCFLTLYLRNSATAILASLQFWNVSGECLFQGLRTCHSFYPEWSSSKYEHDLLLLFFQLFCFNVIFSERSSLALLKNLNTAPLSPALPSLLILLLQFIFLLSTHTYLSYMIFYIFESILRFCFVFLASYHSVPWFQ